MPLTKNIKTDCAVIGGGITGVLTAYELQKRGYRTVLLEADKICSGSTRKTTAKLTSQHGLIYGKLLKHFGPEKAKQYYTSQQQAIDYIENLVKEKKIDCDFKRADAYLYSRNTSKELIDEYKALGKLDIPAKYVSITELPYDVTAAIRFENQAQMNPVAFTRSIAKELNVYEHTPVKAIEKGQILTEKGKVNAQYIVNTTGYPFLNVPGFYFLRQHQERSYVIAVKSDIKLEGMYYGIDDNRSIRRYGEYLLIGGEKHRTGGNKKGSCYYNLTHYANRYFKNAKVNYSWSNQDCITHDGVPYIGQYAKSCPTCFIATGFNKWGMTNAAVAAQLNADLICAKENPYASLYTPQRFHFGAAFENLAIDTGYSISGLTQGWVFSKKEKRCSHLGCRLKENKEESTLECPCHGSQYTFNGELLRNPAVKSVKKSGEQFERKDVKYKEI